MRRACALPLAAALMMAAAMPSEAAVRALLIGVDDYAHVPRLSGAVNDVSDVEAVLKAASVPVTTLTNAAASRSAVIAAFEKMVAESAPGDLLYVHFSGHGISIPDDNGDEADGRDESYLLASFDENTEPGEQLVDDDLDRLFAAAAGREVMFVADACHSGTPMRAAGAETLPVRLYRPKTDPTRPAPPTLAAPGGPAAEVLAVGATSDDRTVPELMIDGKPRGALSYAAARAFEGAGDLDGDGRIVAAEFEVYVRQTVRNLAASRQTPQFTVPDAGRVVMARPTGGAAKPVAAEAAPTLQRLAVHLVGADARQREKIAAVEGVAIVPDAVAANVILDFSARRAFNGTRDEIATGGALDDPAAILAGQLLLQSLTTLAEKKPLTVTFSPDDSVQPEGQEIAFRVAEPSAPFLTVFNLTGSGEVQALWPITLTDRDPWGTDEPFSFDARVSAPFGADTLVILATDKPPEATRAMLAAVDGERRPASMMAAIAEDARAGTITVGLQAFVTAPGAGP